MVKVISELHYDKNTYFSLIIRDNKTYTRCFHFGINIDDNFIEERSGAMWFYITLKKCVLKNIKNKKEG